MKIIIGKNTHSMAELAMLGIFIIGLAIAWFIVSEKTRINFSDPIELEYTGLATSVPYGDAWDSLDEWQYNPERNLYYLSSDLRLNNQSEIYVEWQYMLAEPCGEIADKLKETSARLNGTIVDEGDEEVNDLQYSWVRIAQTGEEIDKDVIAAIAELPSGRYLKLIIRNDAQSSSLKHIYKSALESVRYEKNEVLEEGSNFVVHLKSIGALQLAQMQAGNDIEQVFFIQRDLPNQKGSVFGYYVERFDKVYGSDGNNGVKARQLTFQTGLRSVLDQSDFVSDSKLAGFQWMSTKQINTRQSSIDTVLESDEQGQMTVTKNRGTTNYYLSNSVVPEILIGSAAKVLLDYDSEKVLIEILASDGQIVPTLLQKVTAEQAEADKIDTTDSAYIIKLTYMHHTDTYEYILFDSDKSIIRKQYVGPRQEYTYQAVDWADLLLKFPNSVDTLELLFPDRKGQQI